MKTNKQWKTRYDVYALIGIVLYSLLVTVLMIWVFDSL